MNNDLINRQATIEKTKKLFEMGNCYCDRASIVGMLNSMPSVQLEPCEDTISREDALIALGYYTLHSNDKLLFACDKLKDLPSVQPEVTQEAIELYCRQRCLTVITDELFTEMKARWSTQPEIIKCRDCIMHGVCRFEQGLGENGFCSQGKRRDEDE